MSKSRRKQRSKMAGKSKSYPNWKTFGLWIALAALVVGGIYITRTGRAPSPTTPPFDIPDRAAEIRDSAVSELIRGAVSEVQRARGSDEAWGMLGMTYLAHGFKKEALLALGEAFRLNSASGKWRYLQAISNFPDQMDVGLELLFDAKRLIERAGTTEEVLAARMRLANVLLENGRYPEAEQEYEAVLSRASDNLSASLGLGLIRNFQGRFQESKTFLEQCVSHPCTRKRAFQTLGVVLQSLGDSDGAEAARSQADRFPEDQAWPDPFVDKVSAYRTGLEAMLEHAGFLMSNGRMLEAATLSDRVIEKYPGSPFGYMLKAQFLMRASDFLGAESALREAIKCDQNNAEAWIQLGLALGYRRSYLESVECLRRAVELSPLRGDAHFNLGFALMSMENDEEALDSFKKAIRFQPELVDSYIAAARIFEKASDFASAKEYLERALSVNPGDPRATEALKRVALMPGRAIDPK